MPEVTIIGAGPAGSVAAILLARGGWRVNLVEQHDFPRHKVCGECISALGIETLERLGVIRDLEVLKPVILTHASIHAPDGRSARLQLPRPMWGLSRFTLDLKLLEIARTAGVELRQPVRCEKIDPVSQTGARPIVHLRALRTSACDSLASDWILVADGKAALLPDRPKRTSDFGIKTHFTGLDAPRDAIDLFGVHGHYGGVAPIEGGRWNVAFTVPAALVESSRGDLDALFARIVGQNRSLATRFATARRVSDWLAAPLPRFPVGRKWPPGVIPLGNAAAAVEPIGGEGMGLAMRSAELAAEFLAGHAGRAAPSRVPIRRAFNRLWRVRRTACRAAARVISVPGIAGPAVDWLIADRSLARGVLWGLGKSW